MDWFRDYRLANKKYLPSEETSRDKDQLLSLVHKDRMFNLLKRFLDEDEFLAPGGIRALSKYYGQNPYTIDLDGRSTLYNMTRGIPQAICLAVIQLARPCMDAHQLSIH